MIPFKDDNPTTISPIITVGLIIINCLVFLFQLSLGSDGVRQFVIQMGTIPYEITHLTNLPGSEAFSPFTTIFTSMFLHGGWMHLIGNMLYLWIFGNNIEDSMGHLRFIFFYLLTGVIASISHVISDPSSQIPSIGASGAIAGVLGAYLILFPFARVHVLFFFFIIIKVIRLPAVVVLGFWFILQLFEGLPSVGAQTGGVAWFAHIGGFIAGVLMIKIFQKKKHDSKRNFVDREEFFDV